MKELNPKVSQVIFLLFPAERQNEVENILKNECGENLIFGDSKQWYALMKRVQFAVLKLSQGDMNKLRSAVEMARLDFRDVLMAADFNSTGEHKRWVQSMLE